MNRLIQVIALILGVVGLPGASTVQKQTPSKNDYTTETGQ